MNADFANRSPDIHLLQGINPTQVDLFSHNELLIKTA
jgi:hypothetical protein